MNSGFASTTLKPEPAGCGTLEAIWRVEGKELEFADFGFGCGGEDVEADAGSGDGGESFDSFVADGASLRDGLPLFAVPGFDAELVDALAVVETLHQDGVIEGDRLGEIHFERGMMRASGRGPEGVGVAIESGFFISGRG